MDREEMILQYQESENDNCHTCSYKINCKNQCMEVKAIYNTNLK